MMWAQIIAWTVMSVTDYILDKSRPEGVSKDEWRKQVQANADKEMTWLDKIIKDHEDADED